MYLYLEMSQDVAILSCLRKPENNRYVLKIPWIPEYEPRSWRNPWSFANQSVSAGSCERERESHRTLHTTSQAIQSPKIWKEKMASLIMLPTSNTRLNAQNTKARLFSITRTIPMPMPKMQFPLPKQNKTKLKYQTTL
jgi:hypothetical protein